MKRQEKVCRPTSSSGEIMSIGNRSRQNQQLKEGLHWDKETHRAGWRRRRPWTAGSGKQEKAQLLTEVWACVSLGRVFPPNPGLVSLKKDRVADWPTATAQTCPHQALNLSQSISRKALLGGEKAHKVCCLQLSGFCLRSGR